jgi:hypothetical protein
LAGFENARGGQIAVVAVSHGALGGLDEVRGGLISERDWIADIQISDAPSECFDRPRFRNDVTNRV